MAHLKKLIFLSTGWELMDKLLLQKQDKHPICVNIYINKCATHVQIERHANRKNWPIEGTSDLFF